MAFEGRIRDHGLLEVIQLVAVGRKTGTLHCHDPLQGRHAHIGFDSGVVVSATVDEGRVGESEVTEGYADASSVERIVHDVLRLRDGVFRFVPNERPRVVARVRLAVEPILREAAQRTQLWPFAQARVPHPHVVPAFVDGSPQQVSLLRLTPSQWELLTYVDGERDLTAIAAVMQREHSQVAALVHDLVASGLMTLRERTAAGVVASRPVRPSDHKEQGQATVPISLPNRRY